MLKLYYASSVCSLAVRITLHEIGIECAYEAVNLKTKQTETGDDFLNINPKGSVPVLQLSDNQYLTENAVILQYLADTYNATNLLPPLGDLKRYRTLEWLNFVGTDLHRYCAPLFWSKIPNEVKENLFAPALNNKLLVVDQHLQNHQFLMGDQFTLADSYLFVILVWLVKLRIDMRTWPNLSRYYNEMVQREAVKLALKEENILE